MTDTNETAENTAAKEKGTLTKYIAKRGYGFITPEGKEPEDVDIFVHHTEMPAEVPIKEGASVSYEVGTSEHNEKDVVAVNVEIIEKDEETTED